MTVPAAVRDMLGLTEGQEMVVSVKRRQVIVEPVSVAAKTIKVRLPTPSPPPKEARRIHTPLAVHQACIWADGT
ncbi:AbrB/MazE/SpoVT family DNA-binding domain-containing protein [Rhizobium ruizarguesonis]